MTRRNDFGILHHCVSAMRAPLKLKNQIKSESWGRGAGGTSSIKLKLNSNEVNSNQIQMQRAYISIKL